jgi:hypothetical protein
LELSFEQEMVELRGRQDFSSPDMRGNSPKIFTPFPQTNKNPKPPLLAFGFGNDFNQVNASGVSMRWSPEDIRFFEPTTLEDIDYEYQGKSHRMEERLSLR